jgi:hypothetical protein
MSAEYARQTAGSLCSFPHHKLGEVRKFIRAVLSVRSHRASDVGACAGADYNRAAVSGEWMAATVNDLEDAARSAQSASAQSLH